MTSIRTNWTIAEISKIYHTPLLGLVHQASIIHREYHNANTIKISTLISMKTGACVEDCAYCAQSSRYNTHVDAQVLEQDQVIALAKQAQENGVPRICLSASWKEIPINKFDNLLDTISKIRNMGLDVCLTMGSLNPEQAKQLAKAGVTAYNHNIDTSKEYYNNVITTRTFDERIETINTAIEAGLQHCSGGIIGMGETNDDRISMLHTLATLKRHPYSVPLNTLIPIPGTPLEHNIPVTSWEIIRMIATTRIIMPATQIELAAGRINMTDEAQALCFMAGANSIFVGKKLLTTENPTEVKDKKLLDTLGIQY